MEINVPQLFFILASLNYFTICDEVNDYVQLITEGMRNAAKYPRRLNNEDLYSEKVFETTLIETGLFDFIILGAGSAGAIVAKRLSESNLKVLLLEAGDYETNYTDIPAMFRQLQFSDYNWGYYTAPQKHTCQGNGILTNLPKSDLLPFIAMINKRCPFSRGKSIGGTSAMNGIIYARGNPIDQKLWEQFGITGWSWDEVLPYYKRLEDCSNLSGDQDLHGSEGPVNIEFARSGNNLERVFLNANEEIGTVSNDYNGRVYMASGKVQFNKFNGRRASTGRTYLKDFDTRYLTISTKSLAYKIIINGFNRAIGVEYMKDFRRYRVFSKDEVIVAAGTVNSPQLLMLSGIGPKEHLAKHQIPLVKDLPVGQNLEDHLGFHALQFKSNLKLFDRTKPLEESIREYLSGTGPLENTAVQGLTFLSTENNSIYPDIEAFVASRGELNITSRNEYNFNKEALDEFALSSEEVEYVFRIAIVLIHPKSKGSVTLQSKNPKHFPIINPNSLSDPDDLNRIYKSLAYITKLIGTKAFKEINATLLRRELASCGNVEYLSEQYWKCMIRHVSSTANHPVGTCRMGSGINSVVDNRLKVHGVRSLRVVDLSVAPRVNSGHSNALAMMIGEKAADLIKEDYWLRLILSRLLPNFVQSL